MSEEVIGQTTVWAQNPQDKIQEVFVNRTATQQRRPEDSDQKLVKQDRYSTHR